MYLSITNLPLGWWRSGTRSGLAGRTATSAARTRSSRRRHLGQQSQKFHKFSRTSRNLKFSTTKICCCFDFPPFLVFVKDGCIERATKFGYKKYAFKAFRVIWNELFESKLTNLFWMIKFIVLSKNISLLKTVTFLGRFQDNATLTLWRCTFEIGCIWQSGAALNRHTHYFFSRVFLINPHWEMTPCDCQEQLKR